MKPILTHILALAIGGAAAVFLRPASEKYGDLPGETQRTLHRDRGMTDTASRPPSRDHTRTSGEKFLEEIAREPVSSDFDLWLETLKGGNPRSLAEAQATVGLLTGNPDLIREALEADPDNPQLLYMGATFSQFSDEERLGLAERFFTKDPDNGLAAYLYAQRLFATRDQKAGLDILRSSAERKRIDSFSNPMGLLCEDAFVAAGYSNEAAKVKSMTSQEHSGASYAREMARMGSSLSEMANSLPAGEASEIRSLAASIGGRFGENANAGSILDRLVGLSLEAGAMRGLPDDGLSPYQGLTVEEADQSIGDEAPAITRFLRQNEYAESVLDSDPELASRYVDHVRLLGDVKAIEWLENTIKTANK